MSEFRLYAPEECDPRTGYPAEWHATIKHAVRAEAGHRCVRCGHPYRNGEHGSGEWSPCDGACVHGGPIRCRELFRGDGEWVEYPNAPAVDLFDYDQAQRRVQRWEAEAFWRILTVHHLDGDKTNCRWLNLCALCQRCHLQVQGRVRMDRPWPWTHTEWMRPYAAAFYALRLLGEELTRDETMRRLDELLALGASDAAVERMPLG